MALETLNISYDVVKFNPKPSNEFLCAVCFNVLHEARMCPCHHIFCNDCIKRWLDNSSTCPTCRNPVRLAQLELAPPLVQNVVNGLTMDCDYKAGGCDLIITKEMFPSHLLDCDYRPVTCTFQGCSLRLLAKDLTSHREQCQHRSLQCAQRCHQLIPAHQLDNHDCFTAMENRVKELEKLLYRHQEAFKWLRCKLNLLSTLEEPQAVQLEAYRNMVDDINRHWHQDQPFPVLFCTDYRAPRVSLVDDASATSSIQARSENLPVLGRAPRSVARNERRRAAGAENRHGDDDNVGGGAARVGTPLDLSTPPWVAVTHNRVRVIDVDDYEEDLEAEGEVDHPPDYYSSDEEEMDSYESFFQTRLRQTHFSSPESGRGSSRRRDRTPHASQVSDREVGEPYSPHRADDADAGPSGEASGSRYGQVGAYLVADYSDSYSTASHSSAAYSQRQQPYPSSPTYHPTSPTYHPEDAIDDPPYTPYSPPEARYYTRRSGSHSPIDVESYRTTREHIPSHWTPTSPSEGQGGFHSRRHSQSSSTSAFSGAHFEGQSPSGSSSSRTLLGGGSSMSTEGEGSQSGASSTYACGSRTHPDHPENKFWRVINEEEEEEDGDNMEEEEEDGDNVDDEDRSWTQHYDQDWSASERDAEEEEEEEEEDYERFSPAQRREGEGEGSYSPHNEAGSQREGSADKDLAVASPDHISPDSSSLDITKRRTNAQRRNSDPARTSSVSSDLADHQGGATTHGKSSGGQNSSGEDGPGKKGRKERTESEHSTSAGVDPGIAEALERPTPGCSYSSKGSTGVEKTGSDPGSEGAHALGDKAVGAENLHNAWENSSDSTSLDYNPLTMSDDSSLKSDSELQSPKNPERCTVEAGVGEAAGVSNKDAAKNKGKKSSADHDKTGDKNACENAPAVQRKGKDRKSSRGKGKALKRKSTTVVDVKGSGESDSAVGAKRKVKARPLESSSNSGTPSRDNEGTSTQDGAAQSIQQTSSPTAGQSSSRVAQKNKGKRKKETSSRIEKQKIPIKKDIIKHLKKGKSKKKKPQKSENPSPAKKARHDSTAAPGVSEAAFTASASTSDATAASQHAAQSSSSGAATATSAEPGGHGAGGSLQTAGHPRRSTRSHTAGSRDLANRVQLEGSTSAGGRGKRPAHSKPAENGGRRGGEPRAADSNSNAMRQGEGENRTQTAPGQTAGRRIMQVEAPQARREAASIAGGQRSVPGDNLQRTEAAPHSGGRRITQVENPSNRPETATHTGGHRIMRIDGSMAPKANTGGHRVMRIDGIMAPETNTGGHRVMRIDGSMAPESRSSAPETNTGGHRVMRIDGSMAPESHTGGRRVLQSENPSRAPSAAATSSTGGRRIRQVEVAHSRAGEAGGRRIMQVENPHRRIMTVENTRGQGRRAANTRTVLIADLPVPPSTLQLLNQYDNSDDSDSTWSPASTAESSSTTV